MSASGLKVGDRFTLVSVFIEQMRNTDLYWLRGQGDGVAGWPLPNGVGSLQVCRAYLSGSVATTGTNCDLFLRVWKNASSGTADMEAVIPLDGSTGWAQDEDETPLLLVTGDEMWVKAEIGGASTPIVSNIAAILEAEVLG